MIVGSNILAGASGQAGYFLNRSVRLRASASAYFNRTFGTPTNNTVWSYSGWNKLGVLGTTRILLGGSGTNYGSFGFETTDQFRFWNNAGAAAATSTAVFRDPSAWYHVCVISNGTTIKAYINNSEILSYTGTITNINSAIAHNIGRFGSISYFYDGYLTEINFIDGQALTPTSFGEYNTLTGVWQPKKYGGTYGTNGFYLNFNDNSAATAAAIGKDSSGNGNNWTPNNISVTAGVTYDSMTDVPTLTSATNANFAVMNPLNVYGATITNGNLQASTTNTSNDATNFSTVQLTSGKWYAEFLLGGSSSNASTGVGVSAGNTTTTYARVGQGTNGMMYKIDGNKESPSGVSAYGATYTYGDLIGVALDLDASPPTITFYKNNTSQGSINLNSGSASTGYVIGCTVRGSAVNFIANFGAGSGFTYTPPTGFVALNTYNLPAPTIPNGATQFAATTYTGTGAARTITNTVNGISMQPDFVWIKDRSVSSAHALTNSVTGITKYLESNTTLAETTDTTSVTALNSNGFNLGAGTATYYTNRNGEAFVAWQWKASNAAAVTNTSGSISSQVSANPSAGFSIVTFTCPASGNFTVGHGLGVAPAMFILKTRNGVDSWYVYHKNLATPASNYLVLNTTAATATSTGIWGNTNPTSSVLTLGTNSGIGANLNGLLYCFSEIAGYSKAFSYTGNGSTDGVFVYCGFRPRWIMIKKSSATGNWSIVDTSRDTFNVADNPLLANTSGAETTSTSTSGAFLDILSNGFKLRGNSGDINDNTATYIGFAVAENPFNYSLAR